MRFPFSCLSRPDSELKSISRKTLSKLPCFRLRSVQGDVNEFAMFARLTFEVQVIKVAVW